MTLQVATVPLAEITAVIDGLRDEALYTWRRQSQKVAIVGWRDSKVYPGALARFETGPGFQGYGFALRRSGAHYMMGGSAVTGFPYLHSGALRDSIAARKPISKNAGRGSGGYSGGDVVTTISIDGAALNLLSNKHGYRSRRSQRESIVVQQPDYVRTKGKRQGPVKGSLQHRFRKVLIYENASQSYREEFALRDVDLADMKRRDAEAFPAIVRAGSFTKTGKLKTSVVAKFQNVEQV